MNTKRHERHVVGTVNDDGTMTRMDVAGLTGCEETPTNRNVRLAREAIERLTQAQSNRKSALREIAQMFLDARETENGVFSLSLTADCIASVLDVLESFDGHASSRGEMVDYLDVKVSHAIQILERTRGAANDSPERRLYLEALSLLRMYVCNGAMNERVPSENEPEVAQWLRERRKVIVRIPLTELSAAALRLNARYEANPEHREWNTQPGETITLTDVPLGEAAFCGAHVQRAEDGSIQLLLKFGHDSFAATEPGSVIPETPHKFKDA